VKVSKIKAVFFLLFWPSRLLAMSLLHDRSLVHEPTDQTDEQMTLRRIIIIRRSFKHGFLLVVVTLALGYLSGMGLRRLLGQPIPATAMLLQVLAAGVLLGATVSILGWDIQSFNGQTLPEKVNRWTYRGLYFLGTYVLVLASTWQGIPASRGLNSSPVMDRGILRVVLSWLVDHGIDLLALVVAGLILYKELLEKARISASLGPSLDPVAEGGTGNWMKIHAYVILSNRSRNAGVVEQIRMTVRLPDGRLVGYDWDIFFRTLSSRERDDESVAIPISVAGNSSILKGVQFKVAEPVAWTSGRYELYITTLYFGGLRGRRRAQDSSHYWFEIDVTTLGLLNQAREEAIQTSQPRVVSIRLRR